MSERAIALPDKIATKAEEALSPLNREMAIMGWPPEFRKIMWDAVAQVAAAYADQAAEAVKDKGRKTD
jgi:hypothetical protein